MSIRLGRAQNPTIQSELKYLELISKTLEEDLTREVSKKTIGLNGSLEELKSISENTIKIKQLLSFDRVKYLYMSYRSNAKTIGTLKKANSTSFQEIQKLEEQRESIPGKARQLDEFLNEKILFYKLKNEKANRRIETLEKECDLILREIREEASKIQPLLKTYGLIAP
jgi:cell division protein FtsB